MSTNLKVYFILFRVELTLCKKDEQEVWSQVVVGDNRGEMTMDPAMIAQIHERLAGLTSDQLVSVSHVVYIYTISGHLVSVSHVVYIYTISGHLVSVSHVIYT
jgi:hypothetical protein